VKLATQIGVGIGGLIVFFLVVANEKIINSLLDTTVAGTDREIAALQGR
jgi:hypothetical protein